MPLIKVEGINMPITGPIPLPSANFGAGIAEIPNDLMRQRLMEAQTQHAQANAAQSNMMAKLLEGVGGSMGNGENGSQMGLNRAMLLAGALHMPTQVVEGNLITPFGSFKVGETKAEGRAGEAQKEAAAATLKSTASNTLENANINGSIESLKEMMDNPAYENLAGTAKGKIITSQPLGLPVGSWLQKTFPGQFSPEEAQMAGAAQGHFGAIVTGVAQKFKGPFRNMVNSIIGNMKPNMGDSLAVQKGKLKSLSELSNLADEINGKIAQNISNGMDPTAAILKATKETPMSKIQEISNRTSKENHKANNSDMITIIDHNGKEHSIHRSNIDKARQRDPQLKVKQNG